MNTPGAERRPVPVEVRSLESDGITLLYRAWEVDRPLARVYIVHGLGEHGGRHSPLGEALRDRGVSSYAMDLRGHGVSGGRRGHVEKFNQYLDDLLAIRQTTGRDDTPQLLFGHSLGGLVVIRALQRDPDSRIIGAVLSAPALGLAGESPRWRDPAASVLSRVAPTVSLPNGIDPEDLSHDPVAVEAYRNDPLIHDRITPRLYREMRRAMQKASHEASRLQVPVLLLLPGDDRIVDSELSRGVADRFAGPVTVQEYPRLFHELLQEPEGKGILRYIVDWITARIP